MGFTNIFSLGIVMFIHYEYIRNIGNKWKYKILDDDFTEEGEEEGVGIWSSAIDTYEKRNLPVAKNLIRVFRWYVNYIKQYGHIYDLAQTSDLCKRHNTKYKKYANEVEKYLLLM